MIRINDTKISCGVKQIYGIHYEHPRDVIEGIANSKFKWVFDNENWCVQLIFSDSLDNYHAFKGIRPLEGYIRKHKLGKIEAAITSLNSNSYNKIRTCIWAINIKKLRTFLNTGKYA